MRRPRRSTSWARPMYQGSRVPLPCGGRDGCVLGVPPARPGHPVCGGDGATAGVQLSATKAEGAHERVAEEVAAEKVAQAARARRQPPMLAASAAQATRCGRRSARTLASGSCGARVAAHGAADRCRPPRRPGRSFACRCKVLRGKLAGRQAGPTRRGSPRPPDALHQSVGLQDVARASVGPCSRARSGGSSDQEHVGWTCPTSDVPEKKNTTSQLSRCESNIVRARPMWSMLANTSGRLD